MIYTVVTPGGQILLDKADHAEFDSWLNNNRCYIVVQSKRRHARYHNAPDELVLVVAIYHGPRRR